MTIIHPVVTTNPNRGKLVHAFKSNIASVLNNHDCAKKDEHLSKTKVNQDFHIASKVWRLFEAKYPKSPSHTNNNTHLEQKSSPSIDQHKSSSKCKDDQLSHQVDTGHPFITTLPLCSILFHIFLVVHLVLVVVLFLALHKPTQVYLSRNSQDLIYPFMRATRLLTLPFVQRFPELSDLYEEPCLVSNPFFSIEDSECWPCESVRHVIDLTGFSNFSSSYHHSGVPFVVKDALHREVKLEDFKSLHKMNPDLMEKTFLRSNITGVISFRELFFNRVELWNHEHLHIEWKVNKLQLVRLLRQFFTKPYFIPATAEVSLYHYIFIDQRISKSFLLPVMEFANIFLLQSSGTRSIVLIPTNTCRHDCKVVSIVLQPRDVLFYNWLYWRPVSIPVDSLERSPGPSITYMGSFY